MISAIRCSVGLAIFFAGLLACGGTKPGKATLADTGDEDERALPDAGVPEMALAEQSGEARLDIMTAAEEIDETSECMTRGPCTLVMAWVPLPAGTFMMGTIDGHNDEQPLHEVFLSAFEMAKTETTQAQYEACVIARACIEPACGWEPTSHGDHPVTCVAWHQSKAYCEWVGGRLCTEAEWEYAARSGGKDQNYPWGDATAVCDYAVMGSGGGIGCGAGTTWVACSKPEGNSIQGICDLAGNVWEAVADWCGTYPSSPQTNPAGPGSGPGRVGRGGGLENDRYDLWATRRVCNDPDFNSYDNAGFRCCRPAN